MSQTANDVLPKLIRSNNNLWAAVKTLKAQVKQLQDSQQTAQPQTVQNEASPEIVTETTETLGDSS